ncbi:hypothetical protein NITHO_1030008 [Nitrolancea hollandica Lb]|uniref:Uncharacterized protein n=1 Tax=Nitrolancea hollandica Lb TaxID=1129897 RepID=I4ECE2_9BACT|nr:hypothetical protein NITHO_1030008 [Nitrolancea hollandica Lb]
MSRAVLIPARSGWQIEHSCRMGDDFRAVGGTQNREDLDEREPGRVDARRAECGIGQHPYEMGRIGWNDRTCSRGLRRRLTTGCLSATGCGSNGGSGVTRGEHEAVVITTGDGAQAWSKLPGHAPHEQGRYRDRPVRV